MDGFTVNDVGTGIDNPGLAVNALYQNHPNPFNPTATIGYSIEERGHVTLKIYNAVGQLVRSLVDEVQSPQSSGFSVVLGCKNDAGVPVASGLSSSRVDIPPLGRFQLTVEFGEW